MSTVETSTLKPNPNPPAIGVSVPPELEGNDAELKALAEQSAVATPTASRRRTRRANASESVEPSSSEAGPQLPQLPDPRQGVLGLSPPVQVTLDDAELLALGRLTRLAMRFQTPLDEFAEKVRAMLVAYDKAKL